MVFMFASGGGSAGWRSITWGSLKYVLCHRHSKMLMSWCKTAEHAEAQWICAPRLSASLFSPCPLSACFFKRVSSEYVASRGLV